MLMYPSQTLPTGQRGTRRGDLNPSGNPSQMRLFFYYLFFVAFFRLLASLLPPQDHPGPPKSSQNPPQNRSQSLPKGVPKSTSFLIPFLLLIFLDFWSVLQRPNPCFCSTVWHFSYFFTFLPSYSWVAFWIDF